MNKHLVTISMLFFITGLSIQGASADEAAKTTKNSSIIWKYGVAVQDGKALYIDPDRLWMIEIFISAESIRNSKDEIIKASKLIWCDEVIYVYDSRKSSPYEVLLDTKRIFHYKIENNRGMLSEDGNDWEVLQVKIVDDRERPPMGPERIVVYMIVHLECRWFKGDYEISSPPD